MAQWKLTSAGDLDLSTNNIEIITGSEEIAQNLRTRLRFFLGEWFLDTRLGVPYFQQILRKRPLLATVREILRRAALTTPGVLQIDTFAFDLNSATRSLSVDMRATITGGEVLDFTEELIVDV